MCSNPTIDVATMDVINDSGSDGASEVGSGGTIPRIGFTAIAM